MRESHQQVSLWDGSAEESDWAGSFPGDCQTELAVVGGGFTGLSTALHAALAGIDCHVVEAQRLGHGGSGRNVGLVNAGLWLPPQEVRARLGEAQGGRLLGLLSEAPERVFDLIERHQIRCEAKRAGTIHAAHSAKGLEELRGRAEAWQQLGAPVRLLDADDTRAKTGSAAFHGGLLDARAGTINPMGYVRGLARAACGAGAHISTGTRVTALRRESGQWRLETPGGTLRANRVLLATNAYSDELWPGLMRAFTPISFFQVATEPLGEAAHHVLPEGQGLWDTGRIMFALRRDAAGRIIMGSMGALIGDSEAGLSARWARRQLRRLFPDLGEVRFETAWDGRIAMTADHLPRIHRLDEGLYTPLGYNGRGIGPGTVFGQALAAFLSGGEAGGEMEALPLPVTGLKSDPNRGFMARFYRAAFAANQLIKSL